MNLHDRILLAVTAQVLRDRDPIIRLTAIHEWEGVGAFYSGLHLELRKISDYIF
jgi:hypothetical protein